MWVVKLKFKPVEKYSLFAPLAKKFNVSISGYPLSNYEKKGIHYYSAIGSLSGELDNIDNFHEELKRDKRVIKVERNKNLFITLYKQSPKTIVVYNPELIFFKPIIIENGNEIYEIAMWEREDVNKFIKKLKKTYLGIYDVELLKVKKEKVGDFLFKVVLPSLTDKQRSAMELAIKKGYYRSPRNIDLQKLAELSKLSFSTYQVHLRKAEEKLIPYFFE